MELLRIHVAMFTAHTSFWNDARDHSADDENCKIALRLLPTTMSLIQSQVNLINSGFLYTAEIVFRSALERSATISYVLSEREAALRLWRDGWKMGDRPSLRRRVETFPLSSPSVSRLKIEESSIETARQTIASLIPSLNSAVHGDEFSLSSTIAKSDNGFDYYHHSNDLESPEYASVLSMLASYLPIFLTLVLDNQFRDYLPRSAT